HRLLLCDSSRIPATTTECVLECQIHAGKHPDFPRKLLLARSLHSHYSMSRTFTGASLTILLVAGLAHFASSFDKLKLKHASAPPLTADRIETTPPDYVPQVMRESTTATPPRSK